VKELNRDGEWVETGKGKRLPDDRSMADLLAIAWYQRVILFSILFLLINYGISAVVPESIRLLMVLPHLAIALLSAVYVFRLSLQVYGTAAGIALAILVFIPCIGLIVLAYINSKATGILTAYGVRVEFLGVSNKEMSRLKRWAEKDGRNRHTQDLEKDRISE